MQSFSPMKEGKVREIYDAGDSLIMVATDRISAFDVILKNQVVGKGTVLTQMSKFWFDYTSDVIKNHMISTDTADMPEFFRNEKFEGRSMKVKKLTMLPIECIVRGYITGSGWASYQKTGLVCGIREYIRSGGGRIRDICENKRQRRSRIRKRRGIVIQRGKRIRIGGLVIGESGQSF